MFDNRRDVYTISRLLEKPRTHMNIELKKASLLFAALVLFVSSSFADVVYRNTTGDLLTTLNSGTREVGDEIILGGTSRSLTNFTLQYSATANTVGLARLRFYENNGAPSNGYTNTPGSVFFDSGTFSLDPAPTGSTLIFDLETNPEFALFTLPDHFTWSMQFTLAAGSGGVDLFNPVTVGSSYADFWENDGTGWALRVMTNGTPVNFAAQIEAVPEPSTFALGALGFAVFAGVFARRQIRGNRI